MQYDEMIVYYLPFADLPNRFWRICPTVLTTLPHRFCRFAPSFLTHLPHFSFFVLIAQIWRLTGLSYWTFLLDFLTGLSFKQQNKRSQLHSN